MDEFESVVRTLKSNRVDFFVWVERPENRATSLSLRPYRKEDVCHYFASLQLYK